ncbi:hypothetical protein [Mesobacillus zeae]|uniref:hypothetical protein n=1 Tax=Mesobacillus zeae TaxID=1917180 RepID=UPI003009F012
MIIEFYTEEKSQFLISLDKVYRNGEVVAEGEIKIQHLLMNDPAWIVVNKGEDYPPITIRTDIVSAVLPSQEFFNGERCCRKDITSILSLSKRDLLIRENVVSTLIE